MKNFAVLFLMIFTTFGTERVGATEVVTRIGSDSPDSRERVYSRGGDMPIGQHWLISVDLSGGDDFAKQIVSIEEALLFMRGVAPDWYLQAVFLSSDEHYCSVRVNNINYSYFFERWVYHHLRINSQESHLNREFRKFGIETAVARENALGVAFCVLIKSGDMIKAKEQFAAYGQLQEG